MPDIAADGEDLTGEFMTWDQRIGRRRECPSMMCGSVPQIPTAPGPTTISPGPGVGSGKDSILMVPGVLTTAARIMFS